MCLAIRRITGSRNQDKEQKYDMKAVFREDFGSLDYIACWFYKGAKYIENSKAECAFVTTNSICQGLQVALLWKRVLQNGVRDFIRTYIFQMVQ